MCCPTGSGSARSARPSRSFDAARWVVAASTTRACPQPRSSLSEADQKPRRPWRLRCRFSSAPQRRVGAGEEVGHRVRFGSVCAEKRSSSHASATGGPVQLCVCREEAIAHVIPAEAYGSALRAQRRAPPTRSHTRPPRFSSACAEKRSRTGRRRGPWPVQLCVCREEILRPRDLQPVAGSALRVQRRDSMTCWSPAWLPYRNLRDGIAQRGISVIADVLALGVSSAAECPAWTDTSPPGPAPRALTTAPRPTSEHWQTRNASAQPHQSTPHLLMRR